MEESEVEKNFTLIFKRYREPFTLFINSYIRDIDMAEDIYVDAMMQYWEKRNDLAPDTNIPAYILTSVKHKALNYLRHLNIKDKAMTELLDYKTRELNFRISSLEMCDPMEIFSDEIQNIVREVLSKLPEQTRVIFCKSRFENRTNRDIADELGISMKTVEYHITKSLKVFRFYLKDYLLLLPLIINSVTLYDQF